MFRWVYLEKEGLTMTRFILFAMVILCATVLFACGGNDSHPEETNEPSSEATTEQSTPDEEEKNDIAPEGETDFSVPFEKFELEVTYENAVSYEVEFEKEGNDMEAEIDDDLNQETKRGEEALSQLEPIFKRLTFDEDTPNEEVITEVLESFQLADDFQKLELEIKYETGTEKEYEETR